MAITPDFPSTPAEEIFPDRFRSQAFDLVLADALSPAQAFEQVALLPALRSAFVDDGLVAPLELIVAEPNGRHTIREISATPVAVLFVPTYGGTWRVTLREQAHMRWWGNVDVSVIGEPAS